MINDIIFIILRISSILCLGIGIFTNIIWMAFLGLFLLVLSNNQMINELQNKIK